MTLEQETVGPALECRYFPVTDREALYAWLLRLRQKASAPGSHYQVAAILGMRCATGMVYFGGVNVECLDHRQSVHAEESAIAFMVAAMGKKATIHDVWAMGAPAALSGPCAHAMADLNGNPCGNCRQQISGLAADSDVSVHCLSLNGGEDVVTIGALLPDAFQFDDFNVEVAQEREAARGFMAPEATEELIHRVIRPGPLSQDAIQTWLGQLQSIDYASRVGQAVIIGLDNGFYVAGVKVDNAAYTGLNAAQAALGIATTNFGQTKIQEIYALSTPVTDDAQGRSRVYPLSLSSLQSLNEAIAGPDVPVTLFTQGGEFVVLHYSEAVRCFSTFAVQFYVVRDGCLHAA